MKRKEIVLSVANISKQYRLGQYGTGTISHDLNRWWSKVRGNGDPYAIVGEKNDRTINATEDYIWALKDINFNVKKGEILGIIGKNGAGKSTLLKVLSRITSPSTGEININGRVASLLEVGTGMHPELTGKENIFLNGAILGMNKNEISSKLDEIVDFAGIAKYVDTPIKRYSSGMKVRLGFAVAAFLEPEILIVDEVLAVGDAEFQKKAIGKMKEVTGSGQRTVLFVSHNMGSIKSLCNRALMLSNGELVFEGDVDECVNNYLALNTQEVFKDLSLLKTRNGNGKLKFSRITFLNKESKEVAEVLGGEYLKLKIDFNINEPIDFKKLILSIAFKDNYDNTILSFVTDEMGITIANDVVKNYITLEIPSLKLRGGKYFIRLLAMDGDTSKENFLDEVNSASMLNVLSSDFWNIGKTMRTSERAFLDGKISIH